MLDWIVAFLDTLTCWIPRLHKCPPTHRIIKWAACGEGKECGPGLIWYWPVVTEIEECDIRWESTVTTVQSITMIDGKTVSARVLVVWRPDDVLFAVGENRDYSDRVAETAQSVLVDVLGSLPSETLSQVKVLNATLTMSVKKEMDEMGIQVHTATFTELCTSPAFRLINDA